MLGEEKYGKSLVRYVHDLGLLDERMMVIHAIWIDDGATSSSSPASGCTVAHNPVCNLRLGSGVMPYYALRAAGVPICLGSDEMNTDDTHQHVVRRQDRGAAPEQVNPRLAGSPGQPPRGAHRRLTWWATATSSCRDSADGRWRIRTQGSGGAPCSVTGVRIAKDLLPGLPCD